MDETKRKLYQARGHLLKAEVILRALAADDTDPRTRPHVERARWSVSSARKKLYDYIFARYGGIKNLEAYR